MPTGIVKGIDTASDPEWVKNFITRKMTYEGLRYISWDETQAYELGRHETYQLAAITVRAYAETIAPSFEDCSNDF